MPRGDGSGPMGTGSMTGRAAGYCAGYPVPGFMNPTNPTGGRGSIRGGFGCGFGRGFRGGGRGWGQGFNYGAAGTPGTPAPPLAPQASAPEQEIAALRDQASYIEQTLEHINKRLQELEGAEPKSG